MAKRLTVLMGVLAVMLATALPASAESEPQLTGVIEKPEVTSYMYGTHAVVDEVGGDLYALESDIVDLDAFVGQRVTVFGSSVRGYENGQVEGGPPLFDVTRVEPAAPGESIEVTFELAAECEPPAGTTFYGLVGQQPVELTNPDRDDSYGGALALTADFGTFEIPVAVIAGDPANPQYVIEDFGEVGIEDGDLFSADVSFCDDGPDGDGGNSDGGAVVSGDTNNANKGGEPPANSQGSGSSVAKVLPATGGLLPIIGLTGLLTLAVGLMARRINR